jgi:hypothetical protein
MCQGTEQRIAIPRIVRQRRSPRGPGQSEPVAVIVIEEPVRIGQPVREGCRDQTKPRLDPAAQPRQPFRTLPQPPGRRARLLQNCRDHGQPPGPGIVNPVCVGTGLGLGQPAPRGDQRPRFPRELDQRILNRIRHHRAVAAYPRHTGQRWRGLPALIARPPLLRVRAPEHRLHFLKIHPAPIQITRPTIRQSATPVPPDTRQPVPNAGFRTGISALGVR